jgi:putative ATPase
MAIDFEPLAARIRPQTLEEFFGQEHIVGEGKPLRKAIEQGKLHSMILWGPPGTGKTTLAHLIAKSVNAQIEILSAVSSGIKDIRELVEKAKKNQKEGVSTVLFVDEVHRFNKAQQDAFLPHVESGLLTFIGATTENPSFELNKALLSRTRVYILKSLETPAMLKVIEHGLKNLHLDFPENLREKLVDFTQGDARNALNYLEIISKLAGENGVVTETLLEDVLTGGLRRFDKGGEDFYNQISALHKSVRGSAPDASLYWLARMLDGGCDPLYIARRVVRMAIEDVGNADPRALDIALAAWDTQERLGSPEGELAIAQAVAYLAVAPKSNAVYMAFKAAKADVEKYGSMEVPLHLRNAPTDFMKGIDYGKGYRYAHDEPEAYAAGENYFPDKMPKRQYYHPTPRGLEAKISEKLEHLKSLDQKFTKH